MRQIKADAFQSYRDEQKSNYDQFKMQINEVQRVLSENHVFAKLGDGKVQVKGIQKFFINHMNPV